MIVYRKTQQLRIKRAASPAPPWWFATAVAPYAGRRALPVAIDYLDLHATSGERLDVSVTENVRDQLQRVSGRIVGPVLVDCADVAETIFRRGGETLALLSEWRLPSMALVSPRGELPSAETSLTVLAAWPPDAERIAEMAAALRGRAWGMVVPVIFPATTELETLDHLRGIAAGHGARFLAPLTIEVDPTARQALAQALTMPDDEETYGQLFHSDLEPLLVATERHIAALAAEAGLEDFVVPPGWGEKSNWNAAVLLTMTAARMLAMETDLELAGAMARSARLVAALDKPLARIAEAASLAIIEGLDEASADVLNGWLEGAGAPFVDRVNRTWRLRRDAGMRDEG